MVTIGTKVIGKQKYYYLEHTYRENKKVKKKELYLGKEIPKHIEEIKRDFINSIYREKWYNTLDKIKKNYSNEIKITPISARKKELEAFMIKFTYDTQRIEGSKLTLRETANLLENGISPKSKPIDDIKEAEAHKQIFYEMLDYKKDFSFSIILHWHKNLFQSTKPDI